MQNNCHPRLSANAQRLGEGKGTQVVPHSCWLRTRAVAHSLTSYKLWDLGPLPLASALTRVFSAGDDTIFVLGAV